MFVEIFVMTQGVLSINFIFIVWVTDALLSMYGWIGVLVDIFEYSKIRSYQWPPFMDEEVCSVNDQVGTRLIIQSVLYLIILLLYNQAQYRLDCSFQYNRCNVLPVRIK